MQVKVEFLRGVQSRFEKENGDLMLVTDYAASPYLQEEALPAMDCVLCAGRSHALANAKRVSLAQLQEHVELSVQHSSEECQSPTRTCRPSSSSRYCVSCHGRGQAATAQSVRVLATNSASRPDTLVARSRF
jgi:hypothetical protein